MVSRADGSSAGEPRIAAGSNRRRQQRSVAGGQQDAYFLVHGPGPGAASTAGRSFWREVGRRTGRGVRRHSGDRNRCATVRARGDVELRARRASSRAQPLRFDAVEPSSAGRAFPRSRHSLLLRMRAEHFILRYRLIGSRCFAAMGAEAEFATTAPKFTSPRLRLLLYRESL